MHQFAFSFFVQSLKAFVYTTEPLWFLLFLDENMEPAITNMQKKNPRNRNASSALAEVHLVFRFPGSPSYFICQDPSVPFITQLPWSPPLSRALVTVVQSSGQSVPRRPMAKA